MTGRAPLLFDAAEIPRTGKAAATDVINQEIFPALVRAGLPNRVTTFKLLARWRARIADDRAFIALMRDVAQTDPPPRDLVAYAAARVQKEANIRR